MKHAYLIIAHHEFDILNKLIQAIDDERNDIFIHFDKKVRNCPSLTTHYSNLYILEKRIDIRWGHCSQIEAEYLLFETAGIRGEYHYYHLLSGVHLPSWKHLHTVDSCSEKFAIPSGYRWKIATIIDSIFL